MLVYSNKKQYFCTIKFKTSRIMIYLFYRIKRNPNRIAWLIAILFSALQSFAQSGKLFNTDNQLSSSFAAQVMEDHKGYIWIATRNGLNVYDG